MDTKLKWKFRENSIYVKGNFMFIGDVRSVFGHSWKNKGWSSGGRGWGPVSDGVVSGFVVFGVGLVVGGTDWPVGLVLGTAVGMPVGAGWVGPAAVVVAGCPVG